jgi:RNA polymerase sigma-70 factor (ECF subfamily)
MMGPEQLAQLVDAHAGALLLYARQWCASPEDVVQEAFVRLAALPRLPDNLKGWLYRVVRNAAISSGRSERRRQRHESIAAAARPGWFVPNEGAGIDAEVVVAALEQLPAEEREPLVAHLWGGLTFEQIGELSGSSSSTAHRRYLQALERLRERLRVPCPPKN